MTSRHVEALAFIDALRERGAHHVKLVDGDIVSVEVVFAPKPPPGPPALEPAALKEKLDRAARARMDPDSRLFDPLGTGRKA